MRGRTIRRAWKVRSSTGSHLGANLLTLHWLAISKPIADFTTSVPEPCYALQAWTGPALSMGSQSCEFLLLISRRIKEKLRSGEISISGDNWPIFLYHGYNYNPEDPWNCLLRSAVLVSVSRTFSASNPEESPPPYLRLINIYSHLRARSTKNLKLHDPVTLVSMAWRTLRDLPLPTSLPK